MKSIILTIKATKTCNKRWWAQSYYPSYSGYYNVHFQSQKLS